MLQLHQIQKQYRTGDLVQTALNKVSLNLRDNEFVAILGPSGSGKTTLLNIIGGLDRYDSGDLIINGVSTKKYTDRDWDAYRNHTIGFVFQSYNLIPHQTVLANVELALTISGVSRAERRRRAQAALEQVGLGEQAHKRPGQMSGGQMQRVAIARALVNNPDILLADEPTGALDSETSIQVMELLKQVAKDRLVVMVTHNPELAERYATRIVKLKDGVIRSDSMPFTPETQEKPPIHKRLGKASMSILTSLALSFNNLRTKKARTILTAFAGSIGIIGIALILSLSNGVNNYIASIEKDTLSEYPLQIQSTGVDLTSMMTANMGDSGGTDTQDGRVPVNQMLTSMFAQVNANDLASLKRYLDSEESGVEDYASAIEYTYNISPQIYRVDAGGVRQVHPDQTSASLGFGTGGSGNSLLASMMSSDVFFALPQNAELYQGQYEVKAGHWPENEQECVLVLSPNGGISDFMLYTLGLRDSVELDEMLRQFSQNENIETPENFQTYAYEDFLGIEFKRINAADRYVYDAERGLWRDKSDDESYMRTLAEQGQTLRICGVVQPAAGATATMLRSGIGYTAELAQTTVRQAAESRIVKQQLAEPEISVFSGEAFGTQSSGAFDLASLFSFDPSALAGAFQFSSLDFSGALDGVDLSGMLDADQIQTDLPELPEFDLAALLKNVDLNLSPEAFGKLLNGVLESYLDYAATHPAADYSRLGEYFLQYLQTPEAQQRFSDGIRKILKENGTLTVSPDALRQLVLDLMEGYQKYAEANGLTDPAKLGEYFEAYLETEEAQEILREGVKKVFVYEGDFTVLPEQLEALAKDMYAGYRDYAAANGLADPEKFGETMAEFLQTDEAQKAIADGLSQILDVEKLKQQLMQAAQSYLKSVFESYSGAIEAQISAALQQAMRQFAQKLPAVIEQNLTGAAMQLDTDTLKNAVQLSMGQDELTELLRALLLGGSSSLESNLSQLGYADFDQPGAISIYPRDFESKEKIVGILDDYNRRMEARGAEDKVIRYTDMVGTMMSSVTDIVNIISYVLIAFVAISLVVSSIMIGVITYISVMERRKEIGILRAIGASKRNVSQVFNAETFLIGLLAGAIGIAVTLLLLLPGNAILHSLTGQQNISASLPPLAGLILIALSTALTLLGGLIPSRSAAKCNPVTALRAE